jgi:hypothetical protein
MSSIDKLGDEIAELAAHLDAATQQLLARVRAFDEAEGWSRQGAISCAHWLSWRLGLDTATAREKVRVARALGTLPRLDEAFARGELSYAKVRALTRVATPENECRLLELAREATGAQLERICRGYRGALRAAADLPPAPEERTVRERLLPGGMVKLELVLHPDEAALILQAIAKTSETLYQAARSDENTVAAPASGAPGVSAEPSGAREHSTEASTVTRADAVVLMAQTILAGDLTSAPRGSADHYQVFIHLDQDVLAADGEWSATLDDGSRLCPETLRRVACDAALVPTLTDHAGAVLSVGRRTRAISPALRRALWHRDRGCRFPGCPHTRFLHGHHIRHWLHGGETNLENLTLLCSRHHQLVHEEGFTLVRNSSGTLTFRGPTGSPLPAVPSHAPVENAIEWLHTRAAANDLEIGPDTNLPWWDGVVPDYDWAISSLLTGQ